jgi:Predicted Ser/Thr protein kinase
VRFEDIKDKIEGLTYIGKGWRGIIYKGFFEGKEVAVKVARSEEKEYAIRKEAKILERLKGYPYFPKILLSGEDFFMYEFINGVPIDELELSQEEKLKIYSQVLDIAFLLDSLKINRDEFSRLDKNLLIGQDGTVYLLDFDRGSLDVKKTHNFTQFLQFLKKEGIISDEQAISFGKLYKSNPEEAYKNVKSVLDSAIQTST